MTKTKLSENIANTIENMRAIGETKEEIVEAIGNLLTPLQPKDRERFAAWGYPDEKSTPVDCWD